MYTLYLETWPTLKCIDCSYILLCDDHGVQTDSIFFTVASAVCCKSALFHETVPVADDTFVTFVKG